MSSTEIDKPPADYAGSESACATATAKIMTVKSWYVLAALIKRHEDQSKPSFWVGKYNDVKDHPVMAHLWVDGGKDIQEDCIIADSTDDFKLKRVSCSTSAVYYCEPQPPDCPDGYSFIASIGASSCFKLAGLADEKQNNNKVLSSTLTANKICLEDSTRLAAPTTNVERNALVKFAANKDQIQYGEEARSLKLFTGWMWFDQASTVPASCPTCASLPSWQSGWISPWSDSLVPASDISVSGTVTNCAFIEYIIDNPPAIRRWSQSGCIEKSFDNNYGKMALCEHKNCAGCVFPFIYAGRKYDTCVTHGTLDGSSWCSTEVDQRGYHVEGKSQPCPTDCPKNDCPVGFRKHLKTCLQESASSRNDNPISVDEAEKECLFQGGRLYQPRSTRSLNAAEIIIPRAYDGSSTSESAYGIHNWAVQGGINQHTAIGMVYNFTEQPPALYYKDKSMVPSGLVSAKLNWTANYPSAITNATCITLQDITELSNNDCEFENKSTEALSYICEARSFITTVDGSLENPGKPCIFPFKLEAGGPWQHSCLYDPLPENKWNVWCATEVDAEGVMVPDARGNCDDERNTAYDGPDADNTCKLPFFYDGRWYENCTLYPRDDYWCATNVDPVTREMITGSE